jgi:hypothetical protein
MKLARPAASRLLGLGACRGFQGRTPSMMLMGEISWQGLRSGLAEGGLRGELNIRHRRTPVGHCVSAGGSFALLISAQPRPRIATYRDQEARRALTGPPSESNLGGPCSLLLRFLAPRRRWGWPRDRECIRADATLHLRPCHRRGDREALPSARGIGADRRRAASVCADNRYRYACCALPARTRSCNERELSLPGVAPAGCNTGARRRD